MCTVSWQPVNPVRPVGQNHLVTLEDEKLLRHVERTVVSRCGLRARSQEHIVGDEWSDRYRRRPEPMEAGPFFAGFSLLAAFVMTIAFRRGTVGGIGIGPFSL